MSARHRSGAEPDSGLTDAGQTEAEQTGAARVEFTVLAGDPTPEELAAVTAVLTTLAEESDDTSRVEAGPGSAWQSGHAAVRSPIHPGPGAWRSFSGA